MTMVADKNIEKPTEGKATRRLDSKTSIAEENAC